MLSAGLDPKMKASEVGMYEQQQQLPVSITKTNCFIDDTKIEKLLESFKEMYDFTESRTIHKVCSFFCYFSATSSRLT